MFKPIPGHETLTISLNGQMQYRDGSACALPIAEGKVKLTLYGVTKRWDLTWLGLVAHYEMFFPPGHEHRLFEVQFTPVNPKLRKLVCGHMPTIRKPIEVKPGFRLVLPYPHLALSRDGKVFDMRAMTALTGDDFNTIRRGVKGLKARKDPKWLYRYHSAEPWQTEIEYDKSRPKRILATHNRTREQRRYDSLRACSAAFGVDRDLIKLRLTTGRDHQGWVFTEIE